MSGTEHGYLAPLDLLYTAMFRIDPVFVGLYYMPDEIISNWFRCKIATGAIAKDGLGVD